MDLPAGRLFLSVILKLLLNGDHCTWSLYPCLRPVTHARAPPTLTASLVLAGNLGPLCFTCHYLLAGDVKSLKPSYDQPLYIGRVCVIVLAHVHSCVCAEGLQSRARGCTPLLQPRLRWVLTGALRVFDACALGSPLSGRSFASCCGRAFPTTPPTLDPMEKLDCSAAHTYQGKLPT